VRNGGNLAYARKVLLPCRIFITLKIPSTSVGIEPANLGSSGELANHYSTEGDSIQTIIGLIKILERNEKREIEYNHPPRHTSHAVTGRDLFGSHKIETDVCIQNVNNYELIPGIVIFILITFLRILEF
jgi:hypothetical protein